MAKSLQDQLLQAGLIDKNKAKKARSEQQKQIRKQRKNKIAPDDENKLLAEKKKAEKRAKDLLLNRQKQDQLEQKAIAAQITQLIEVNCQQLDEDGIAYHFNDAGKVKKIHVSEIMRNHISQGKLAIVRHQHHYAVIPATIAEKIGQRDQDLIVIMNEQSQDDNSDDPYADYQVPDDLIW